MIDVMLILEIAVNLTRRPARLMDPNIRKLMIEMFLVSCVLIILTNEVS